MSAQPSEATEWYVPACPDWTAHDLFSHMVGLGADVLVGDQPDDHNAAGPRIKSSSAATGRGPSS